MGATDYRWEFFRDNIQEELWLSLSIVLLSVLTFVGLFWGWEDLLPRLGAILVALAAIWEIKVMGKVRSRREESIIHYTLVAANHRAELLARYYSGNGAAPPVITSKFADSVKGHANGYSKEISLVERMGAVTMCYGTLIWAFGDKLAAWFSVWECFAC